MGARHMDHGEQLYAKMHIAAFVHMLPGDIRGVVYQSLDVGPTYQWIRNRDRNLVSYHVSLEEAGSSPMMSEPWLTIAATGRWRSISELSATAHARVSLAANKAASPESVFSRVA